MYIPFQVIFSMACGWGQDSFFMWMTSCPSAAAGEVHPFSIELSECLYYHWGTICIWVICLHVNCWWMLPKCPLEGWCQFKLPPLAYEHVCLHSPFPTLNIINPEVFAVWMDVKWSHCNFCLHIPFISEVSISSCMLVILVSSVNFPFFRPLFP